ncbi:MAG: hypothetical protein H6P99_1574 [Holophagaceae bacterium]|nr:hypothetical protein [Holophagaceae bacterium]
MALILQNNLQDATLRMEGTFLYEGRSDFKAATEELLSRTTTPGITLDLSAVSYMDSASLGMLLILRERTLATGRKVVLRNPSPPVRSILSIVQFDQLFDIREDP